MAIVIYDNKIRPPCDEKYGLRVRAGASLRRPISRGRLLWVGRVAVYVIPFVANPLPLVFAGTFLNPSASLRLFFAAAA